MDENKKKNNYMINSCLGKRPKVESMGNYMGITCLKIKHDELKVKRPRIERIKRINNYMINYMGNYMAIICLKIKHELPRIDHELSLI